MKRNFLHLFIPVLFIGIGCNHWADAAGAKKNEPPMTIVETNVTAYEEVVCNFNDAMNTGVEEVLSLPDKVVLSVDALVKVKWDEKTVRVNIDRKRIYITGDDDTKYECMGRFERIYQFNNYGSNFYDSRPGNWKEAEKTKPKAYNAAYLVPKTTKSFTLHLGNTSKKFAMPQKIEKRPNPLESVEIKVVSGKLVDSLKDEFKEGKIKETTTVKNPGGKFLEVTFMLTPKGGNSWRGALKADAEGSKHFFWFTPWLGAKLDDKIYVPTVGEKFMNNLNRHVSHNSSKFKDTWKEEEFIFWFPAPEDTKTFTLMYLMAPAGKGVVGK